MKQICIVLLAIVLLGKANAQTGAVFSERAQMGKSKAGAHSMSPQKNIVENIAASNDHMSLLMLLQSANLTETLSGTGPFTVFAPTNAAFSRIPQPVMLSLTDDENKSQLTKKMKFHVVPGKIEAGALLKMIKEGDGTATLTTLAGSTLTVTRKGKKIILSDGKAIEAVIVSSDLEQSNGIIHVIDKVLFGQ